MFEDSLLLGHCPKIIPFPPATLARGMSYVEECSKWVELLPCLQFRMTHTDEL